MLIIFHCIGPNQGWAHGVSEFLAHIQETQSWRSHEGFLPASSEDVDAHHLHIDRKMAHSLDSVYGEQDTLVAAEVTDGSQVSAVPGKELHHAGCDQARPRVDKWSQRIQRHARLIRDQPHFDAMLL